MKTYEFTFLVDADPHSDDFEDRFIEAGCDDATFSLIRGSAALSFDRSAESHKEAVYSALIQIKQAGSKITRFDPDYLVSATEIAARSGLTKAAINLYGNGSRGEGYPKASVRVSTTSPLWDWVDVSKWLMDHGKVSAEVYLEALNSRIINLGAQVNHMANKQVFDIEAQLLAA
ncbi:hypothetical protein [Sulfitobacter sp.]|uniref:hypothetical protein n=1 Tax=Sulfitobacter sp. TaxID=1903071 RepID=UPI00329836C3